MLILLNGIGNGGVMAVSCKYLKLKPILLFPLILMPIIGGIQIWLSFN